MVDYKFSGNDPNKQRVERSPEEVKAMIMGGGEGFTNAVMGAIGADVDEDDGLTYIHEGLVLNTGFERCLGCGMPVNSKICTCGPGCKQCWGPRAVDYTSRRSMR